MTANSWLIRLFRLAVSVNVFLVALVLLNLLFTQLLSNTMSSVPFSLSTFLGRGVVSRHRKFRCLFARILSNDLPPLHSENQTLINTLFILDHEKLPVGFGRLWVLHSIVDIKKQKTLELLLRSRGEWVEILPVPEPKTAESVLKSSFDLNRARNFALELGFASNAEWVFPFDGCSFFTEESLRSLREVVLRRTDYLVHFTPMVRWQRQCELNESTVYSQLFPFVSGQQECQIGVSSNFFQRRASLNYFNSSDDFFFPREKVYGSRDKIWILDLLVSQFDDSSVHCKDAYIGWELEKSANVSVDAELISRCGYMLRLMYYPEQFSAADQRLPNRGRYLLRNKAMAHFTKLVNDSLVGLIK